VSSLAEAGQHSGPIISPHWEPASRGSVRPRGRGVSRCPRSLSGSPVEWEETAGLFTSQRGAEQGARSKKAPAKHRPAGEAILEIVVAGPYRLVLASTLRGTSRCRNGARSGGGGLGQSGPHRYGSASSHAASSHASGLRWGPVTPASSGRPGAAGLEDTTVATPPKHQNWTLVQRAADQLSRYASAFL
jgi:hypothetical protein